MYIDYGHDETNTENKSSDPNQIIDEILDISEAALEDVLDNPETDLILDESNTITLLTNRVNQSDLNLLEKNEIIEKIEETSLNEEEIGIEKVFGLSKPNQNLEKQAIKQQMKDFFDQVDQQESKVLANETLENLAKVDALESLEENSKTEILNNIKTMDQILQGGNV